MKVKREKHYSKISSKITLKNGDVIEILKYRKFGASGWCQTIVSAGDGNTVKHHTGEKLPTFDELEDYARGLLMAVKEARRIESMQLED